jgi:hypothetical protein
LHTNRESRRDHRRAAQQAVEADGLHPEGSFRSPVVEYHGLGRAIRNASFADAAAA